MTAPRRVGLVPKINHPAALKLADEVIRWLQARGVAAGILGATGPAPGEAPDLIVVLGGDGTMLHAAHLADPLDAPLLGVNMGGLGFLTAVTVEEAFSTLELILEGRHQPQERLRLDARLVRQGQEIPVGQALNDFVIIKAARSRILHLTARLDDLPLTEYRADGLIVATPTGSTAYNLSAGGPILTPGLAAVIITPICPFTLANRPLVISDQASVTVELGPQAESVHLTADGQRTWPLAPGDQVVIRRGRGLKLYPSPFQDHAAILRTKLGWGAQTAWRPREG